MNYAQMLKPAIHSVPVYEPGKPIEVVARELGMDPDLIAKMASNENPLGSSPLGIAAAAASLSGASMYPENGAFFLRKRIAERMGLEQAMISVSAGSNDFLYLLGNLFLAPGTEVVMSKPSFITGKIVTLLYGATPVEVPVREDLSQDLDGMLAAITDKTRIVYLPDPNNPTGTICTQAELDRFITALPDHVVLVYDEAYREFRSAAPDIIPHIRAGRKVIGTRTFSKIYGLAGLRVGYSYSSPELAALLNRVRPPFSVSVPALAAALAAIDDDEWVAKCRAANTEGLAQLRSGLEGMGLACVRGEANFVLVRVGPNAMEIFNKLQGMGWIIRPVGNYGLPDYLRISVGTSEQNAGLLAALRVVLAQPAGV